MSWLYPGTSYPSPVWVSTPNFVHLFRPSYDKSMKISILALEFLWYVVWCWLSALFSSNKGCGSWFRRNGRWGLVISISKMIIGWRYKTAQFPLGTVCDTRIYVFTHSILHIVITPEYLDDKWWDVVIRYRKRMLSSWDVLNFCHLIIMYLGFLLRYDTTFELYVIFMVKIALQECYGSVDDYNYHVSIKSHNMLG